MKMKLTEKQKRFADEYIRTANIFQSAINAGYSESYARTHSHKLLDNVSIKVYINARLKELERKTIMTLEETLEHITSTARGEIPEHIVITGEKGMQSIEEIPTQPNTRLKAALEMMKRYDAAEMDELKKEELRKKLANDQSTEDKIANLMNKLDVSINAE
ncbi:Terminase small subunit [Macrococcoides canis]|uniref:Terminase small subunit n=1 Tax=Macrococcoides canis TaxID=1855823 RepID=A0A1W7ACG2_9STAP|nr:terminase small subunit [Macrococcus canis]ARQ07298.1 Terminase small subunit [Macrococcus canis]